MRVSYAQRWRVSELKTAPLGSLTHTALSSIQHTLLISSSPDSAHMCVAVIIALLSIHPVQDPPAKLHQNTHPQHRSPLSCLPRGAKQDCRIVQISPGSVTAPERGMHRPHNSVDEGNKTFYA